MEILDKLFGRGKQENQASSSVEKQTHQPDSPQRIVTKKVKNSLSNGLKSIGLTGSSPRLRPDIYLSIKSETFILLIRYFLVHRW